MKNFKKFGSAFLAGTMLVSSFAVSAYAQDSAAATGIDYLINDDFSNFKVVPTGEWAGKISGTAGTGYKQTRNNNGMDNWRIEGMNDLSYLTTHVSKADLAVGDETLMEDALKLGKETANRIYGARVWQENIGAGDTLVTEFDIYASNESEFAIGLVPDCKDVTEYENGVQASIFKIWNESQSTFEINKVYCASDQQHYAEGEYRGATFKRNEVNHIKLEYTLNDDLSENTQDDVKITITNTAGTTTASRKTKFRDSNRKKYDPIIDSIKGISFIKYTSAASIAEESSDVYIDNVKVYKAQPVAEETLLKEDFSNGYSKWTTMVRNNLSISNDWFTTKDLTDANGNKIMDKAMWIGPNTDVTTAVWGRICRVFDDEQTVGAGESFSIEFDIMADDRTNVALNLIPADVTSGYQNRRESMVMYLYADNNTYSKSVNDVFTGLSQAVAAPGGACKYSGLTFKRNEKNHIKIDYTLNSDLSADTKDSVTMTIENSDGTKSATREVDFRNSQASGNKLNGVKGVLFHKEGTSGESGNMYIDNVNIYKHVSVPEVTNIAADLDADNAENANSVSITFSNEMTAEALAGVFVKDNLGNKITLGAGELDSTGKIYTIPVTGEIVAGKPYIVVVPATVADKAGNKMQSSASAVFYADTAVSKISFKKSSYTTAPSVNDDPTGQKDFIEITATTATEYNGKKVGIAVAGYNENNKMVARRLSTAVADGGYVVFDAFVEALNKGITNYKIFLWDMESGEPLCNYETAAK